MQKKNQGQKKIDPNSDQAYLDELDLDNEHNFPKFLKSIKLSPFRHISDLELNFNHPISVISGINRSGKSTILMALACSHLQFEKRDIYNGQVKRHTWSDLMRFTNKDIQSNDWEYYITYKTGKKTETKKGGRNANTKKWSGIGKKEGQFKHRQTILLDLDRLYPARNFGRAIFNKSQKAIEKPISSENTEKINEYISYILEEEFNLSKLTSHIDKDVFSYNNLNNYSSYNAATGEESLIKIIIDTVECKANSLILIDEIEAGLHPKIQRRLIESLYNISRNENKQFIITSHSPSILASLPNKSRIFIEKTLEGKHKAIHNISINASLSKMDSTSYPLVDIYCEDDISKQIIQKAISSIQSEGNISSISKQLNIITSGAGDNTYNCFQCHKKTYPNRKIKTGFACILDGDRRNIKNKKDELSYPQEEYLHFIYSEDSPEKFLVKFYTDLHPNQTLRYHYKNSDPHCLFKKMIENSICTTQEEAFDICWQAFLRTPEGLSYLEDLKTFLLSTIEKFSTEL